MGGDRGDNQPPPGGQVCRSLHRREREREAKSESGEQLIIELATYQIIFTYVEGRGREAGSPQRLESPAHARMHARREGKKRGGGLFLN